MKTTCKAVLFTTLLSLAALNTQAQEAPKVFGRPAKGVNPENGIIRCATSEYEEYLQENDPKRETREQFEAWLAPKVAEIKAKRLAGKSANAIITIPVVVHVIHNGDNVGSNENIPDGQVLSQIEILNQDFRRMLGTPGYNDNEVGADVEIEFCMAQTDPDGNLTTGIDRVNLSTASWADETVIDSDVKTATYWNPAKYFNIWTVNFGSGSDLLGYAQFPNSSGLDGVSSYNGAANTDGLVVGYKYFGSYDIYPQGNYGSNNDYKYGRTATHEIGHCFGLIHVCGDNFTSCTVNSTDSIKDYCLDTPATKQYNYTCDTVDSCPASTGVDMIENYMDYTNDQCMNTFTQDQKDRMVAVMNNATRRKSLTTSTVCTPPAAGTQGFNMNGINLYPNPATSVINIAITNGDLPDSYTVYNSLGQTVTTVKVSSSAQLAINTSVYSNGVYFVKIDKGTQSKTLKFIKN